MTKTITKTPPPDKRERSEAVLTSQDIQGSSKPTSKPTYGDPSKPFNSVSNPSHYTAHGTSPLEFTRMQFGNDSMKGFCLGNALKYIARHDKKVKGKEIEDLEKARWYLDHYISILKEKDQNGD